MNNYMPQWVKTPTKKHLLLLCLAWLAGTVLLTISITDFFSSNPFYKQNIWCLLLILSPAFTTVLVFKNYYKNKKAGSVIV